MVAGTLVTQAVEGVDADALVEIQKGQETYAEFVEIVREVI